MQREVLKLKDTVSDIEVLVVFTQFTIYHYISNGVKCYLKLDFLSFLWQLSLA